MEINWIATLGLFVVTAPAEIVGCYFVLIWVKRDAPLLALAGSTQSRSTPRRSLER